MKSKDLIRFFFAALCFSFLLAITACGVSQPAIGAEKPYLTLIEHLRMTPGVNVRGNAADASVSIRGINSINLSSEPLLLINGQVFNGNIATANQQIPAEQIKSVHVMKDVAETGLYGVRGANGVIDVILKGASSN